ncbi:hypothetical protein [Konateibacter massiliensis]|uniref:hypothetical protein n=1 Tax=Konateibacter massiliensis TaxID=2002841 RepID=UPI00117BB50D|nr:hypothetical protein [Konateibacter massiliensis]
MLRIYVCFRCGSTRIVSNDHDSSCLRCDIPMSLAPITYEEFVNLDGPEREILIGNWMLEESKEPTNTKNVN